MVRFSLLIIDPQIDFHPGGSLAVAGANEDAERISELILNNLDNIDQIFVTLDSHHRLHLAHSICWTNKHGEHPPPFTLITHNDITSGKWVPVNDRNLEAYKSYTKSLEEKGRFLLCIWPEHCLIGTPGHAVMPCINAAIQEWSGKSLKTVKYVMKGQNCFTEMYSAIAAEVGIDSDPATLLNHDFIDRLNRCDKLVVCGQAKSHCVNFTMRDIMAHWRSSPANLFLLSDGCSSVPGFEKDGEAFEKYCREGGVTVTTAAGFQRAASGK